MNKVRNKFRNKITNRFRSIFGNTFTTKLKNKSRDKFRTHFKNKSERKRRLILTALAVALSGCGQADEGVGAPMGGDVSMEAGASVGGGVSMEAGASVGEDVSMEAGASVGEDVSMGKDTAGSCQVHEWEWRPLTSPTCSSVYEVQEVCAQCGAEGEMLTVGPDDHDWEDKVESNGNCVDPKVITHSCKVCGAKQPDTVSYESRARALHDYQPYSGSCVEPEYGAVVFYRCEKCSRCGNEVNKEQTGFELLGQERKDSAEQQKQRRGARAAQSSRSNAEAKRRHRVIGKPQR